MCVTKDLGADALWTKGLTADVTGAYRRSCPPRSDLHMTPCFHLVFYLYLFTRFYCSLIFWPSGCLIALDFTAIAPCLLSSWPSAHLAIITEAPFAFFLHQASPLSLSKPPQLHQSPLCILHISSNSALQKRPWHLIVPLICCTVNPFHQTAGSAQWNKHNKHLIWLSNNNQRLQVLWIPLTKQMDCSLWIHPSRQLTNSAAF